MAKNKIFLISFGALFALSACQAGQENVLPYSFNSAKITYQISGTSEGSSEVYIQGDNKSVQTQITRSLPDGSTESINTHIINRGEKSWTLDPGQKEGVAIDNPLIQELAALSLEERKRVLFEEMVRLEEGQPAPEPIRTEQIAGETCEVYKIGITETCYWEYIPLKTVAISEELGINTTTIATSIEKNVDIPPETFQVPSDYQITNI